MFNHCRGGFPYVSQLGCINMSWFFKCWHCQFRWWRLTVPSGTGSVFKFIFYNGYLWQLLTVWRMNLNVVWVLWRHCHVTWFVCFLWWPSTCPISCIWCSFHPSECQVWCAYFQWMSDRIYVCGWKSMGSGKGSFPFSPLCCRFVCAIWNRFLLGAYFNGIVFLELINFHRVWGLNCGPGFGNAWFKWLYVCMILLFDFAFCLFLGYDIVEVGVGVSVSGFVWCVWCGGKFGDAVRVHFWLCLGNAQCTSWVVVFLSQ